jgi:3-hydroxymyristoyl/3-hydroxydecanoyl-(acyl carrier protein) dehydratase
VDSIPRDAQGKIPTAALRALFAPPTGPRVEEETLEEGRLLRRCSVPDDLAFLDGHFPGFPVVPGIAQLAWAVEAAGEAFGAPPAVRGLEALKFHRVLLPGQSFHLELLWRPDRRRFGFRIFDGDQVFASGRCLLEEAR